MTREEEMWKAVTEEHGELSRRESFVTLTAMEWADKTMLDRTCEWLKLRISVDVPIETNENGEPLADSWIKAQMERAKAAEEVVTEFRQAMEGGAE